MLDDLYAADNAAIAQDLVQRPPMAVKPTAKFSLWKTTTAAPRGVAAGANESAGFMADMLGAFGQVAAAGQTGSGGMFSTLNDDDRKASDEARKKILTQGVEFTSEAGQDFRATAKTFMPDPETSHTAENVIFGLGRFATKAVGYSAMGGPVVGAGLTGLDEGMTTASDLKDKGVDLGTRTQVGAVAGVAAAAGVALPVAGKTLAQTAGLVVVGGPGAFVAQQAATRQILQDADYTALADQYDPFDPVGLAVSTLVPAGFGAFALRGAAKGKVHPTTDQVDAARVAQLNEHIENTALHSEASPVDATAHLDAVSKAVDQLAKGERVNVTDLVPAERVDPARADEIAANMRTARNELAIEDPQAVRLLDEAVATRALAREAAITQGQPDGNPGNARPMASGQGDARGADAGPGMADRGRGPDSATGGAVDSPAGQPRTPERTPGAGSDGDSGAGSVGHKAEAAAINQRLMAIKDQHPDLHVHIDGMDAPMRLADFLDEVKRQSDADVADAPLYQVAAECFITNGQ